MKDPTWGFPEIPFSYDGIKTTVTWAELLAGIKVNVYKNFYMGWSLRYRIRMNIKRRNTPSLGIFPVLEKTTRLT